MPVKHDPLKEVDGWVRPKKVQKVNADNIFDYMDGAGELYLAYSFVGLDVWKYKKPAQPDILVEVYQMADAADAFGVLSFELGGDEVGVGQKSVYAAGLLRFWKGTYFVRVLAEAETSASKAAVMKIGNDIAGKLSGEGTLPALVAKLPENGLLPESVHYFHTKLCLDYFYYLADDNILNLSEKTNAVLADYETPAGRAKLLVVEYDLEASSLDAWKAFHRAYLEQEAPEAGETDSKQIEGEQWVCSRREENLLLISFEGKDQNDSEELLRRATENSVQGG